MIDFEFHNIHDEISLSCIYYSQLLQVVFHMFIEIKTKVHHCIDHG